MPAPARLVRVCCCSSSEMVNSPFDLSLLDEVYEENPDLVDYAG
jgi:hypothetical protein